MHKLPLIDSGTQINMQAIKCNLLWARVKKPSHCLPPGERHKSWQCKNKRER